MSELQSLNPATGEVVGTVKTTPATAIPEIVQRARAAQADWREHSLEKRGELLKKAGERLLARAEEVGTLVTREMGKPLNRGVGEARSCGKGMADKVDEIIEALQPQVIEDERRRSILHYDPFGVCAAITPWNYPISMPHWMVVPALMAGNAVVLKPSEETPLCGQAYADALNEVLPPDVLQVVHGADEQGKALVASDIDLVAFTGSRAVGKAIMAACSDRLTRVILELGGKDPLIVLEDADLDAAAAFAAGNSFDNSGQMCVSTERIYVDSRVAEPFCEKLVEHARQATIGDPEEETTTHGPMVNETQRSHVLAQLDDAISKGARVLLGGEDHPPRFVRPTVLTGVTHEMAIMEEETFGPVACVQPFESEEEAIRRANDNPYGLGAAVFGSEPHALEVARRLDSGMTGVNQPCFGASGTPWVGAKESGYGFHGSTEGHRQFAQVRMVTVSKK